MSKRRSSSLDASRRNFLKGAGLAGAATLAAPVAANAQATAPRANLKALPPGPRQIAVETKAPEKDPVTQSSSGGDFMVDVMKSLDIEYLAMNCASSFRGLHEAILNHGDNKTPEIRADSDSTKTSGPRPAGEERAPPATAITSTAALMPAASQVRAVQRKEDSVAVTGPAG